MARLLAIRNPSIFTANDIELHKSIPKKLQKILVLDEWHHKDFNPITLSSDEIEINKPSSYETWNLLADVIERNDPTLYKPTLKPNTRWSNYPDAGTY